MTNQINFIENDRKSKKKKKEEKDKHFKKSQQSSSNSKDQIPKNEPFSSTSGWSSAAGSSSCLLFFLILNNPPSLRKLLFNAPNLPLFLSSVAVASVVVETVIVPTLVTVSRLELLSPTVTYSPEVLHASLFRSSSDEERAITVSGELPPSFALSFRSIRGRKGPD